MDKKIGYSLLLIAILAVGLGYYFIKLPTTSVKQEQINSQDPFGAPPKGTSPNCGPEERYKFDVSANSKEDFVNFVKTSEGKLLDQYGNNWVKLDNFKDDPDGEVNWNKVLDAVKTEHIGSRTIYVIEYTPSDCSPAQKFSLKMTNDGHVSVYGCCGK